MQGKLHETERRVEAARYALLRRLAFAMRHHMVVHLQPIGMITEVLERRLQSPSPDLAQAHESMARIKAHSNAAVQSSVGVVGWLAPEPGKLIALGAGVDECVDLLGGQLNFRGFALRSEVVAGTIEVARCALRSVLPAALLALTDRAGSPAEILVTAQVREREVLLDVQLQPVEGAPGFQGAPHYRLMEWDDVDAIAAAEGATLARRPDGVAITLPA